MSHGKRSSLEIIYQTLLVTQASHGITKTQLVYRTNSTLARTGRLLDLLVKEDLIVRSKGIAGQKIEVTRKGAELIQLMEAALKLIGRQDFRETPDKYYFSEISP